MAARVFLLLGALVLLPGGTAGALCLDLVGHCSSPAPERADCHEQAPDDGLLPGCGECVDVAVADDAAAGTSRCEHDLGTAAHAPAPLAWGPAALARPFPTAHAPRVSASKHPSLRSTVLLI